MRGVLYEEHSVWLFLLVTLVLGGWLAIMTGRACAQTWRGIPETIAYLLVLGLAVRFAHFALFEGTLLSLHYYVVDTVIVSLIGLLSWRRTRADQMVHQYWWLYERTGPLTWTERSTPLSSPTQKHR